MIQRYIFLAVICICIATIVYSGLYPIVACSLLPTFAPTAFDECPEDCIRNGIWKSLLWTAVTIVLSLVYLKFSNAGVLD
jgi:hypothetical protein